MIKPIQIPAEISAGDKSSPARQTARAPLQIASANSSLANFSRGFAGPQGMELRPVPPPLTCQLAMPASAGANSLPWPEHAFPIWIAQLAPQSKSCFFVGYSAPPLPSASAANANPGSSSAPALSSRLRGNDFPVLTPRPFSNSTCLIRFPRPSLSFFIALL